MDKYKIIVNCNATYDGVFFYGVKTTKIFCKPSCKSRKPLEKNTIFFKTKEEAMNSGYRACKRCRSDLITYNPDKEIVLTVKELVEQNFKMKNIDNKLNSFGLSKHRLNVLFKKEFEITINEFKDVVRLEYIRDKLINTDVPIIDIAHSLEFESISAFYKFFKDREGLAPKQYREIYSGKESFEFDSLVGVVKVCFKSAVVTRLSIIKGINNQKQDLSSEMIHIRDEILEYLNGTRRTFTFEVSLVGTDFQKSVWKELLKIPYGEVRSYKQIADAINKPGASRAVGIACNKNPLLLVVPCHRVVSHKHKLTGYQAGIEIKKRLLKLENKEYKYE